MGRSVVVTLLMCSMTMVACVGLPADFISNNNDNSPVDQPESQPLANSNDNDNGNDNNSEPTADEPEPVPCLCASEEDCDDGDAANGLETCVDCTCVPGIPPECLNDSDCTSSDVCTQLSLCDSGNCVETGIEELTVSIADPKCTDNTPGEIVVSCSTSGDASLGDVEISIEQTSGDPLQDFVDHGDGTATFINFDSKPIYSLTCSAVSASGCEAESALDVLATLEVSFSITLAFEDQIYLLDNTAFLGGLLESADNLTGSAFQPGGLQSLASAEALPCTTVEDTEIEYSCVSGPDGAEVCQIVTFENNNVPNDGISIVKYAIGTYDEEAVVMNQQGDAEPASFISFATPVVTPGDYTFMATASTPNGGQLTSTAVYTLAPKFQVFNPVITALQYLMHGATFVTTPLVEATVAQAINIKEARVIAQHDGVLRLSTVSLGEEIELGSVSVSADPTKVQSFQIPIVAPAVIGKYDILLSWDSDLGEFADATDLNTNLVLEVNIP